MTFNITDPVTKQNINLKPKGSQIDVTNLNKMEYLSLYVYHKLDKSLEKAVLPFRSGFKKVIDIDLIQIFSEEEFELLISGGRAAIDIRDLQKNCNYAAGYKAS